MAELSEDDCIAILRNPLEQVVGHLRSTLAAVNENEASDSQKTFTSDESDSTDADHESDVKDAISSLLSALQGHRVAVKLKSKDFQGTARGQLAILVNRLDSGQIETIVFQPLVQAVVQKASDVEIWKHVLRLITSASRITPPQSTRASFGGTPRTYSSASHEGSEQTKRLLRDALTHELKDCAYVDVQGVFEKYFDDRSWTQKSMDIYDSIRHTYSNGRWKTFPSNPTESAVWSWWSDFQAKHLVNSRGAYYTTKSTKELRGLDSKGQLDIFIKRQELLPASAADDDATSHDWADVRVIGEHTMSEYHSEKFWQLAKYARSVFSAQPRRLFVLGFILANTSMELYTFDRSGVFRGEPFDIHKEPERFIRVICGYSMMSDEELGLDPFIERNGKRLFVTVDDEVSGSDRRLEFSPMPIARRAAIVGRNTSCYNSMDKRSVVKFSWVSASRTPTEPELLRLANERKVEGVPRLVGQRQYTSVSELRQPLKFTKKRRIRGRELLGGQRSDASFSSQLASLPLDDERKRKSSDTDEGPSKKSRSNSQASKLSQVHGVGDSFDNSQLSQASQGSQIPNEPYVDRLFCCQVTEPAGRPLTEFRTVKVLLQVLRDAIKVHRSLLLKGKILHRDVSASNIVICDPQLNDGLSGMLIDVELGTIVEDWKNTRTQGKRMTGTLKYMAIEVVELGFRDARPGLEHTYRHDLESFFYVFLDMCINHGWSDTRRPRNDALQDWYIGSYDSIVRAKLGDMVLNGFETLVAKFSPAFEPAKHLAMMLRDALFLLPHSNKLRTGTPAEPPQVLYDQMIGAFEEAIKALTGRADV